MLVRCNTGEIYYSEYKLTIGRLVELHRMLGMVEHTNVDWITHVLSRMNHRVWPKCTLWLYWQRRVPPVRRGTRMALHYSSLSQGTEHISHDLSPFSHTHIRYY